MAFRYATLTDVGRVRTRNEDLAGMDAQRGLFLLADGMGGHPAGDLASRVAIESALSYLTKKKVAGRPRDRAQKLGHAVLWANASILHLARLDPATAGMGTTLSAIWLQKTKVHYAHVGDSRIYRLRGAEMVRLTRDHTVVRELVERGELDPNSEEAQRIGHILTQAVGLESHVVPDVDTLRAKPNDVYLLCSDGLSDTVSDEQMGQLITAAGGDLGVAARALVDAALAAGGHDNVTVVLAAVPPAGGPIPQA